MLEVREGILRKYCDLGRKRRRSEEMTSIRTVSKSTMFGLTGH
jgi:hypothetical protein